MCIHGLRPGPQHRCVPASSCGGCWKEHWPFPQEWTCYHRFYSCLHINKAHTCDMLIPGTPRYAGIFHMPSQGRAWQESLPQCIWDRDSSPIPPRLFLFPFLCCPLLPVLGIIPTISLSCTPLFRIHSTLESCRVDRSFPLPHRAQQLCLTVFSNVPRSLASPSQPPLAPSSLLSASPWKNLLKRWGCMCVSLRN